MAKYTYNKVIWPGVGDSDVEPDITLLEDDDTTLLYPRGVSPSIFTKHAGKSVCKKYSLTIALVILCCFLTTALVVVTLKYITSMHKANNKTKLGDIVSLKHFIHISDTHLDIYYDSSVTSENGQFCRNRKHNRKDVEIMKLKTTATFGRIGCDSPLHLLESLQSHLRNLTNDLTNGVEFILLTGDQVGHDYESFDVEVLDSVLWSVANSTKTISDALPGTPIFMSVGNNDLKVDYDPPVDNHSVFYRSLYNIFEVYVFPKGSDIGLLNSKDEFKNTFQLGGYYSLVLNGGNMLVVVVNTNYWCTSSYQVNKNITMIGDLQIKWLRDQLHTAKVNKQKVIITGHIPPGISSWNGQSFWLYNYTNIYVTMMTLNFSQVIIGQLYGHTHRDKIKLQYLGDKSLKKNKKSFLLTCPSVTPVQRSNPAFRVYDYNKKELSLQDYTQYYLDLAVSNVNKEAYWLKEYSFRDTYHVALTVNGVEKIIDKFLQPSSSVWFHYSQHITAKMGEIPYYQRYLEFCASKHFTEEAYTNCTKRYKNIGV